MFFGSRRMGNLLQVCRRLSLCIGSCNIYGQNKEFQFPFKHVHVSFFGEKSLTNWDDKNPTEIPRKLWNNWCVWICWEQDSLPPAVVLVGVLPQQMMQTYVCFLFLGVDFSKFVSETAHVVKTHGYCMTCSSSSHSCKKAIKELLRRTIYINSSEVP